MNGRLNTIGLITGSNTSEIRNVSVERRWKVLRLASFPGKVVSINSCMSELCQLLQERSVLVPLDRERRYLSRIFVLSPSTAEGILVNGSVKMQFS